MPSVFAKFPPSVLLPEKVKFFELRKCFDMIAMLWGLVFWEFGEWRRLGFFP